MLRRRILYVENDRGNVAGSIRALHQLITHLDRERFEPVVGLSLANPSPMLPDFEALGCEIVRLAHEPLLPSGVSGARRWLQVPVERARAVARDLARAAEVRRVIRSRGIDLVHANNNLQSSRYAIWGAVLAGVPVVCHQRTQFAGSWLGRLGSRWVDAHLCISRTIYDDARRRGARPKDMRIVYDGVAVPPARPPRAAVGQQPRILIAGRLVEWKGQHVVVEALPRVHEKFPEARLLVAGGPDGTEASARYASRLREGVAELGLAAHVDFLGHVADIGRLMAEDVDVIVHASITPEPFGLVVAEAMAAGRPIVASNAGACPEIVEDGRSGLLFTPGDPEALARQLLALLSNPDETEAMVARGFERVCTLFAGERTTREVEGVYREILGA